MKSNWKASGRLLLHVLFGLSSFCEGKQFAKNRSNLCVIFIVCGASIVVNLPLLASGLIAGKNIIKSGELASWNMSSENLSLTGDVEMGTGVGMFLGNDREKDLGSLVELDTTIPTQRQPVTSNESNTGRKHGPDEKPHRVGNKLAVILVYQLVIFLFFFGCGAGWFTPSRHRRLNSLPNSTYSYDLPR